MRLQAILRSISVLISGVVEYLITQEWSPLRMALTGVGVYGLLTVLAAGYRRVISWKIPKKFDTPPQSLVHVSPESEESLPLADPSPPSKRTRKSPAFSPRTAKEMMAEVEGQTDLAAKAISRRHTGNWLKFSGSVGDIIDEHDFLFISCKSESSGKVFCAFEYEWKDRLGTYNPGDKITVVGKIVSVSSDFVSLVDCSLEEG